MRVAETANRWQRMLNWRTLVFLSPLYIAGRSGIDAMFPSAAPTTAAPLWAWWSFALTTLAISVAVVWFLLKRINRATPADRRRVWGVLLAVIMLWGFIDDGLADVITHLFHAHSIWVEIAAYVISLLIALGLFAAGLWAGGARFHDREIR
ncbi:hypothetical protein BN1232_06241 [Mycobacterium lentiflavum]|nr:hypothetical protein BN1232_06241 [Mycobacterium lentiflavum]